MRQLIETLKMLEGEEVRIYTEHDLFGKQRIEMEFEPETEIGVGFRCGEQAIYIDKDDLVDYAIGDNYIVLSGRMMHITIQII